METKGNRKVDDVWNALKLDTRCTMRDISSSRITTVDWNSFHIRDAVKPKKKVIVSAKSARDDGSSVFADYSLAAASQIFLNSEGGLEVGCPSYECKDKCRSSKRTEECDTAVEWSDAPQPDFATLQYAKLKAAYQEKLRREKMTKSEAVSDDVLMAVDGEKYLHKDPEDSSTVTNSPPSPQTETLKNEEDPHDDIMSSGTVDLNSDDDDDVQTSCHHHMSQDAVTVGEIPLKVDAEASSTNLPPPRTETLKKEEDLQNGRSSWTVNMSCDGDSVAQTDYHHDMVQEHLNKEKFEKIKEPGGSITDVGLGESGKGLDLTRNPSNASKSLHLLIM